MLCFFLSYADVGFADSGWLEVSAALQTSTIATLNLSGVLVQKVKNVLNDFFHESKRGMSRIFLSHFSL